MKIFSAISGGTWTGRKVYRERFCQEEEEPECRGQRPRLQWEVHAGETPSPTRETRVLPGRGAGIEHEQEPNVEHRTSNIERRM